jgi:hypothetical protein
VLAAFLVALQVGCGDGGGKIIAPKDTKPAPPPPESPAGAKPKMPKRVAE